MPTTRHDDAFASMMADEAEVAVTMPKSALDIAIDWISDNLEPHDVFTDNDLNHWAESKGYKKDE